MQAFPFPTIGIDRVYTWLRLLFQSDKHVTNLWVAQQIPTHHCYYMWKLHNYGLTFIVIGQPRYEYELNSTHDPEKSSDKLVLPRGQGIALCIRRSVSYLYNMNKCTLVYNFHLWALKQGPCAYEGCSKFFHLENVIFAKKKFLSPNFRELHVFLSRYMLAKIFKKNVDVWCPQIVPGVWSLVTLHSAAAALKHLRSALRCWSLLTFIGQFWHNKSTA